MSTINVTNLSGRNGSPNLPDGAVVTGVVTSTTFDGNLKSTGTPTLGLGVTINSSGLHISGVTTVGVVTGGTYYGSGSNLTGVGESIGPWYYNPDVNDTAVPVGTGIGITFNKKVVAGSGTATLKIVNAGTAGTTIQSWGISSFTQPTVDSITLGSLVSDLVINQTYQLDIPSGFIKDSNDTDYVGTAYTFTVEGAFNKLFAWGRGIYGQTLQAAEEILLEPALIPSPIAWKAGWGRVDLDDAYMMGSVKVDGTLWMWGNNSYGAIGNNTTNNLRYSSPVQIPGTTWSTLSVANNVVAATKTDGTLWTWGASGAGVLGQNTGANAHRSSPVQVPGTTWANTANSADFIIATKTDGTLWAWGEGNTGRLGLNSEVDYSSPVQIPGTTWSKVAVSNNAAFATRTDGTLWSWGSNSDSGELGVNNRTHYSSPVQIPGTSWALVAGRYRGCMATRTDGTLWIWGQNDAGGLGLNAPEASDRSSPTQIPGTSWGTTNSSHIFGGFNFAAAIKTDGTLWSWGSNSHGQLGVGSQTQYSSPVQIGSGTEWDQVSSGAVQACFAIQRDQTP